MALKRVHLKNQTSQASSQLLTKRTSIDQFQTALPPVQTPPTALFRQMLSLAAWVTFWTTLLSLTTLSAVLIYVRHQQQFLTPSIALVLGGSPERERYAAQFALSHPDVTIWVSSGSNPEYAQWVFDQARVPSNQWYLDYRAVDTVTNFTTLVDELKARNIKEVYLLTSDYHMRRASIIAQIVLGSRGINFRPVKIPTEHTPDRPESMAKELRDGARSILWVVTGKTGSEWKDIFSR